MLIFLCVGWGSGSGRGVVAGNEFDGRKGGEERVNISGKSVQVKAEQEYRDENKSMLDSCFMNRSKKEGFSL
jgi:hypothetical protein